MFLLLLLAIILSLVSLQFLRAQFQELTLFLWCSDQTQSFHKLFIIIIMSYVLIDFYFHHHYFHYLFSQKSITIVIPQLNFVDCLQSSLTQITNFQIVFQSMHVAILIFQIIFCFQLKSLIYFINSNKFMLFLLILFDCNK